jgi:ketosteroid isomerase-like protein
MSTTNEIQEIEARLVQAELGPDAAFFETALADEALLDGQFAKTKVVESHRPGQGPKFTRVEMNDMRILDHGDAAVVTCSGTYESAQGTFTLRFMRVWVKKPNGWQIVAGTVAKT